MEKISKDFFKDLFSGKLVSLPIEEYELAKKIAERAHKELEMDVSCEVNELTWIIEKTPLKFQEQEDTHLDIIAVHCNDWKLDLKKLLESDDFHFAHDLYGIRNCIDRTTGRLLYNFIPRCAIEKRRRRK